MNTNPVSYRTKQQNLLRSKTQTFLDNYSQSRKRIQSRSSMHNLAGTVYSSHQNHQMSPQKHANRSVVFPLIKFQNPEVSNSPAMKGLNMRASHIANYSDINTELLLERKNLEQRIAFLRDQMGKEKKILARADLNCKKASNDIERTESLIRELNVKSERLNDGINEARQDCSQLKIALNNLRSDDLNTNNSISNEQENCANWEAKCKSLKNALLVEEKNKTTLKGELIKEQKVMTSLSILTKELQHERAVLLLGINKSVALNKLP